MILKALGTLPAVYLQHTRRFAGAKWIEAAQSELEGLGVLASSRPAAPDRNVKPDSGGLCQLLKGLRTSPTLHQHGQ